MTSNELRRFFDDFQSFTDGCIDGFVSSMAGEPEGTDEYREFLTDHLLPSAWNEMFQLLKRGERFDPAVIVGDCLVELVECAHGRLRVFAA